MLFEMVDSSLCQRKSPMWQNITCYRSYVGQDDKFVFIAKKKAAYLYVTHFWHFSSEFLGKKTQIFRITGKRKLNNHDWLWFAFYLLRGWCKFLWENHIGKRSKNNAIPSNFWTSNRILIFFSVPLAPTYVTTISMYWPLLDFFLLMCDIYQKGHLKKRKMLLQLQSKRESLFPDWCLWNYKHRNESFHIFTFYRNSWISGRK